MKSKKALKILFLFLFTVFFSLSVFAQNDKPEKIKAIKTITGKFTQFVVGDYIHAIIKKQNGKTRIFFLDSYDIQYFLVLNRGKTMTFTYQIVDSYIQENSGRMIIERMTSARIGQLTFEKWWKDLRKKFSEKQIEKKYSALVEKHTKY